MKEVNIVTNKAPSNLLNLCKLEIIFSQRPGNATIILHTVHSEYNIAAKWMQRSLKIKDDGDEESITEMFKYVQTFRYFESTRRVTCKPAKTTLAKLLYVYNKYFSQQTSWGNTIILKIS